MKKDKLQLYSDLTIAAVGVCVFAYVFIKYIFSVILPFLIAWAVAFVLRPISYKISEKTGVKRQIISAALTAALVAFGITFVVFFVIYGVGEAWKFISGLMEDGKLYDVLSKIMNPLSGILGDSPGASEIEASIGSAINDALSSVLSEIVEFLTSAASSIPRVLIFILITVIASVYFSMDVDKINGFIKNALPKSIFQKLVSFKNRFLSAVLKYFRSYLIIMLMTFLVMLIGFLILRVRYAVLFAFIVAILDMLPIIGVGTILVPWSVYQLAFSDVRFGIGLIVLYITHLVIRQFAEPKIVGKNLGIHPVVSLIVIYVGYCFFGFLGLLLIPLFVVVINILFDKDNSSEVGERLVRK